LRGRGEGEKGRRGEGEKGRRGEGEYLSFYICNFTVVIAGFLQ
jgi:hypothetical protein